MLKITEDKVVFEQGDDYISFYPTGGPEDPVKIDTGNLVFEVTRRELEDLQMSLVNFLNTGYFDMEG